MVVYCGPARLQSLAGSSGACAADALCCVPYVVTLLLPAPRLGHGSGYDADLLSQFYFDICPIFSTALTAAQWAPIGCMHRTGEQPRPGQVWRGSHPDRASTAASRRAIRGLP